MMKFHRLCVVVSLVVLLSALPGLAAEDSDASSAYGTLTAQTRMYYYTQRSKSTGGGYDAVKESLAVGGILKYETPWLADFVGAGVAGYASMPFIDTFNQRDQGGTGLLSSRNQSIFALGEAYIKGRYAETEGRLWRQRIETPFINGNDSRMLPQTFEAYGVKSGDIENLALSLYWVDKEKGRDTELFKSMTEMTGLKGTSGGVAMAGADWQAMDKLSTRFWNYYAPNLDNTFFTQLKYAFGDPAGMEYVLLFQGVDQRSVGDQVRGDYNAAEAGLMGTIKFAGFAFDLGYTLVDGARGLRNSWGNYPFFNNMMGYAFNRSGEKTLLVGVGYDFAKLGWDGYRAVVKAAFGDTPDEGIHATYDRDEYDLNIYYDFDGDLKGMSLLSRFSYQDEDESMGGKDGYQVRLRLQYEFQML